ncbi:hypothetical protein CERZMDRAFT_98680 [Cercospora zeae-maydis SCOH1-5]|uniref:Uncharacterized protein n=1 Tax=Cercospora zeae-maydis SCOH1-5 TaxID=717836 RepID=A0A6A6FDB4_9PEZI|nr:hypothetical protein CERZMDRAFT_98680 [Cercospora zeae-maydis SCOH1-5]
MPLIVQQLATRIAIFSLREAEIVVDVVQEALLGSKVDRRQPARLSMLLTLYLLGTGLRTRNKGRRQRKLVASGLILLIHVLGLARKEEVNRLVTYTQAGAADLGWAALLRFALPRMRKFLIEKQVGEEQPEETKKIRLYEPDIEQNSIRVVESSDSIPELNVPSILPVRPRLIRRGTSVATTIDYGSIAALRQA